MAQNFQRDGKPRLKTKKQTGSSKTATMKVSTNIWIVSMMRNTTKICGKKMTMKIGKKNGQHGRKKPKKNKNAKTKNGKPIALNSTKTLLTTVTSTTLITVAAKKHECLHIEEGEEINCIAELKNKDFWNSI